MRLWSLTRVQDGLTMGPLESTVTTERSKRVPPYPSWSRKVLLGEWGVVGRNVHRTVNYEYTMLYVLEIFHLSPQKYVWIESPSFPQK